MKKKIIVGFAIISGVLIAVFVYSFGYINLDYMFKGKLESISIKSLSTEDAISFIVESEEIKEDFKRIFFNKITSSLGPTTAEGGNYKIIFYYEKADLSFDLILNDGSTLKSYIKYANKNRDYTLKKVEVEFLRKFFDVNNIE